MKKLLTKLPIILAWIFLVEFILRITQSILFSQQIYDLGILNYLTSLNMISPLTSIGYLVDLIILLLANIFYSSISNVETWQEIYLFGYFVTLFLQILFLWGLFKKWLISWGVLVIAVILTPFKDGIPPNHDLSSWIGIIIYMGIAFFILKMIKKTYSNKIKLGLKL